MGKMDTKVMRSETGATPPKGVDREDRRGERHESMRGGVAMGKEDKTGKNELFNTGRTEGICYSHDRSAYR
jgi:hypothetical protein